MSRCVELVSILLCFALGSLGALTADKHIQATDPNGGPPATTLAEDVAAQDTATASPHSP